MKKIYLVMASLLVMAGCSNDELVDVNVTPKQAITFGNVFVENSTRAAVDPSYNDTKLVESFKVYGKVTGSNNNVANIFDGDVVSKPTSLTSYNSTTVWTCSEIQYWIPSCSYDFIAIVDGDYKEGEGESATSFNEIVVPENAHGMPSSIKYDVASQKDLLLATSNVTTYENGIPNTASGNTAASIAPVAFSFDHLLSKVKFTVTNGMPAKTVTTTGTNIYSYKVSNVRMTNAVKKGSYDITNSLWSFETSNIPSYTEQAPLSFGNVIGTLDATNNPNNEATAISEGQSAESHYERLLLPYKYEATKLNIKFTVDLLVNGTVINTKNYEANIAVEFNKGYAYNFNITLALDKKIEFTLSSVTDWVTDLNGDAEGTGNPIELEEVEITESQDPAA